MTEARAIAFLRKFKPTSLSTYEKAYRAIARWAANNKLARKGSGLYSICFVGKDFVVKIPRIEMRGSEGRRGWKEIRFAMMTDRNFRKRFLKNETLAKYIPRTQYVNTVFAVQERVQIDSDRYDNCIKASTMIRRLENVGLHDLHDENVGFRKDGSPVVIDLGSDQLAQRRMWYGEGEWKRYRVSKMKFAKTKKDSKDAFEEDDTLWDLYERGWGEWWT